MKNKMQFKYTIAKKPKVGIVLPGKSIEGGGGAERRFARVFQYFQDQKDVCDIFLITYFEMLAQLEKASINLTKKNVICLNMVDDVPDNLNLLYRYFYHLKNSIKYYLLLKKIIKENHIDILHFISPNLYFIPFILFKGKKPRLIFSLASYPAFSENISQKAKMVFKLFFERVDLIDSLYSNFKKAYPKYIKKTYITPCSFTDYNKYFPYQKKEKWIVFASRLEPRKNPYLFLEALLLVSENIRQCGWKAYIFGKGILENQIKEFVNGGKIEDIINIQSLSDISPILNRSSIFVSLQKSENYPSQSLMEAMASENAVIATDVGDTRRLINENNGILLKQQSPPELAQALLFLINDERLRKILGENARKTIINTHTIGSFAKYLEKLWQNKL